MPSFCLPFARQPEMTREENIRLAEKVSALGNELQRSQAEKQELSSKGEASKTVAPITETGL
jgi:hypothetical protein